MAVDKRAARLGALALVAVFLLGSIGARLWFLQTVRRETFQQQVSVSKTRTQLLVPERGRIFDALGRILADNRRVLTVTVDRSIIRKTSNRTELFTRLSGLIGVSVQEMELRYQSGRYSNFLPLPLREDVPEDVVLQIESRSEDFPGVRGDEDWSRVYPYAPLASHVIGYLGLILDTQAQQYKDLGYLNNEVVGQFGVEKSMESTLHGTWGKVVYEVDSTNHVVREISRVEPVAGKDIQLTIDLKIQQYAEEALQTELTLQRDTTDVTKMARNPIDKLGNKKFTGEAFVVDPNGNEYLPYPAPAGSVVVMDHETGQVIAMASYPNFDNRWFNSGISGAKFKQLFPNDPAHPDKSILVNRAIQGQYNLGSTFKPFVAYAAMITGILSPTETYTDKGSYKLETIDRSVCNTGVRCEYFNATNPNTGRPSAYGPVSVESALAISSDAFFYRLGELTYSANRCRCLLQDQVRKFGFGSPSGIELPFEFTGRVPDSDLKKKLVDQGKLAKGEVPRLLVGDNVQTAIGQGLLAASPLQLANAYSTLANGGFLNTPHIVRAIFQGGVPEISPGQVDLSKGVVLTSFDKAELVQQLDLPPVISDPIIAGLKRVITGRGVRYPSTFYHATTGETLFRNYPYDKLTIAGKTGTAQGFASKPWNDSSAFAAFSTNPFKPYTVVAYLEKSGYGSKAAAPVVKCIFEALSGSVHLDAVVPSDPLDVTSLVPAAPVSLPSSNCLQNPFDPVRD
jgi:penicillin-binding protein 2